MSNLSDTQKDYATFHLEADEKIKSEDILKNLAKSNILN